MQEVEASTNKGIGIGLCPIGRCNNCKNHYNGQCAILGDSSTNYNFPYQVLLLEYHRNLVHVHETVSSKLVPPYQESDGWISVYIESIGEIAKCSKSIVGYRIVESYLNIFIREKHNGHIHCISHPMVRTELESNLLRNILAQNPGIIARNSKDVSSFDERMHILEQFAIEKIKSEIPEIHPAVRERLSRVIAHKTTALCPMIPIILDDAVEEIFLDRPNSRFYFDHTEFGRCIGNHFVSREEVSSLTTLLRLESNLHLDRRNPSFKGVLTVSGIPLRISAAIQPLSEDGFSMEIRRAKKNAFRLQDLVANGSLSIRGAIILVLAINWRLNITITGGPGSGKTTLLNALDELTPNHWRKIYVEDAPESRFLDHHHQIRLVVDPFDEENGMLNKSDEIVKCLHRSPDYVILGEIQTAEHSRALFHANLAGLRTIQTCHGESASGLIARWRTSHDIDESSLALMDLIVTLCRPTPGDSRRVLTGIAETRVANTNGVLEFRGLNEFYNWKDVEFGLPKLVEDGALLRRAREKDIDDFGCYLEGLFEIANGNALSFNDLAKSIRD